MGHSAGNSNIGSTTVQRERFNSIASNWCLCRHPTRTASSPGSRRGKKKEPCQVSLAGLIKSAITYFPA